MRGISGRTVLFAAIAVVAALTSGCRTTTQSGLPDHIRTVEVHIFQNKTMYKGVEAWLTRDIIDRINADPRVRVSSRNGDALITGEITSVNRRIMRETTTSEPGTVQITITATYSFYDQIERRWLAEDVDITSTETGQLPGVYEQSRGQMSEEGERGATKQLAAEIVRRTVGMW